MLVERLSAEVSRILIRMEGETKMTDSPGFITPMFLLDVCVALVKKH